MADDNALDQSEVEKLLAGLGEGGSPTSTPSDQASSASPTQNAKTKNDESNAVFKQSEVETLLGKKQTSSEAQNFSEQPSGPPSTSKSPDATANVQDGSKVLAQNQVESLFKNGVASPKPAGGNIGGLGKNDSTMEEPHEEGVPNGDIDYLLKRAEEALESITATSPGPKKNMPPEVIEFQFPEFGGTSPNSDHATLDQISEVELDLKIELGRTNMYLEDVLKLRKGSVVALDKIAGDAVDIYVNGRLIARGEVLVMNDNFCIRVAELLAGAIPIE